MFYRYRKNGGQILGESIDNIYPDDTYFGCLTNPMIQVGTVAVMTSRVWTGTVIRDATAGELSNFVTAAATDDTLVRRAVAKSMLDASLVNKTLFQALLQVLLEEVNTLRALHSLSNRTLLQAVTAIKTKIDAGTYD